VTVIVGVVQVIIVVAPTVLLVMTGVGGVVFCVTVMLDVAVHPLAAVTVTTKVPAAVKLFAAVAGVAPPDHAYPVPPDAVTVIVGVVQVTMVVAPTVLLVMTGVGGVVFCVTVMLDVAVQPLAAVTVTTKVPAAVKLFAAVAGVAPPDHAYPVPPDAVTVIVGVVQVIIVVAPTVLLVMTGVGGVVFCVTVMLDVAVQPLAAVTVTTKVPAAVKLFAAVAGVAPPDHA